MKVAFCLFLSVLSRLIIYILQEVIEEEPVIAIDVGKTEGVERKIDMNVPELSTAVTELWSSWMITNAVKDDYQVTEEDNVKLDDEMRKTIMKTLAISDDGIGMTVREDKEKGFVSVEKSPWFLSLFDESWTGVRLVVEQYLPKAINPALVRDMVSHLYIK